MKDLEQIDFILVIGLILFFTIILSFLFNDLSGNKRLTYCLVKYVEYEQVEVLKTERSCINRAFNP